MESEFDINKRKWALQEIQAQTIPNNEDYESDADMDDSKPVEDPETKRRKAKLKAKFDIK